MAKVAVMVELRFNKRLETMAFAAAPDTSLDAGAVPKVAGIKFDPDFPALALPGRQPRAQAESVFDTAPYNLALAPKESTYLVRAEIDEKKIDDLKVDNAVVEVFSDPVIEPQIVCPGDPAVGKESDVERLLCAGDMHAAGMDGAGIMVAIVDTGINMAYLNAHGKNPNFDPVRSWVPRSGLKPGSLPVGHGTMCAYDVCIAAPKCTLLDIALLQSSAGGPTPMSGLLSDAVRAYRFLIDMMLSPHRPGGKNSLVVNNSWGMFHPSWDFPPGHPGNYSDNPNHPFNRIVGDLERAGADILFAAGNCGQDCPDNRCRRVTDDAIYGANSHPAVLCVAGVDIHKHRVGYSSIGPGRLTVNKPDISGYTHFRGSEVYPADGGTSAATPVVAGVVAAVRSKRPYDSGNPSTHPAAIRSLLTSTAEDLGTAGYDFKHGYGVVNGCELRRKLGPDSKPDHPICRHFPQLCRDGQIRPEICIRYPWFCRWFLSMSPSDSLMASSVWPGGIGIAPGMTTIDSGDDSGCMAGMGLDPLELAYKAGYFDGLRHAGRKKGASSAPADPADNC